MKNRQSSDDTCVYTLKNYIALEETSLLCKIMKVGTAGKCCGCAGARLPAEGVGHPLLGATSRLEQNPYLPAVGMRPAVPIECK